MITPRFQITQDEESLFIKITVASIRFNASSLEINVDENLFIFHLSPYYLRLRFDHPLIDDEDHPASAEYKLKDECIDLKIPKLNKGQVFDDLDNPLKLLARQGDILNMDKAAQPEKAAKGPLIQDITGPSLDAKNANLENIAKEGDSFDWEIKQEIQESSGSDLFKPKLGFNNQYTGEIIAMSVANGNDINEVDLPDNTNALDRCKERERKENLKFDAEYYAGEYILSLHGSAEDFEINGIKRLLKFIPELPKMYLKWYRENPQSDLSVEFTANEQNQMTDNLPHKEYFIDNVQPLYVTVVNLLYAFIFEQIENEGEHNTESAWIIGKLTPQIAALDQLLVVNDSNLEGALMKEVHQGESHNNIVRESMIIGIKRSLSYPLHRNYELSLKAWDYVYYTFLGGPKLIIKALLEIHELFRFHDVYYVYNKVLLDDLVSWFIKYNDANTISNIAFDLQTQLKSIDKNSITFDCLAGIDEETGTLEYESLSLQEIEEISNQQYQESMQSTQQ
ncbi:Protein SHQ1 [Hanseniaspora osmophila]|uniref:Protein SHQ1 n=1 Tax=Hanseniaspora osmophila TaxID=56408 RepID=A0A1E5RNG9_9ASCO|nr:Protein SHQ1 [Hanseniaspora osmophila]